MLKILKATYRDGELILEEKLGSEWEGKTVDIVIEVNGDQAEDKKAKVERFLKKWKQSPGTKLPEGYKFDRDELYDR